MIKRGEGVSWFDALGKVADHPGVVGVELASRAQGALDVLERQWAVLHPDCIPGSLVPRHKRH